MYNDKMPSKAELPTPTQLVRATLIAAFVAIVLLFAAVLPAELGYDPTGIGRLMGLKKMGEIKEKLHTERKSDAATKQASETSVAGTNSVSGRIDSIEVPLDPEQGAEVKVVLREGAKVSYRWTVPGGLVNHDTHGDGKGRSISYMKGRQIGADSGVLTAAFDGKHGWFWRNRGSSPVVVKLRVEGEHTEFKRAD
ncbi:MAG: transmembrane anchor protein [Fibrobacteres bacterium]|nr:transmembrane anchor protein [Fibrobacterota bacterium]